MRKAFVNIPEFLCWKWKPYPELYPAIPDAFEFGFIDEKFVACCEV
jgi:hypothetical protein